MKKIAVIGSGISGLSAAWSLKDTADVTLFEAEERFGGHSCTVSINHQGRNLDVDVGFIVLNPQTYPNLLAFFEALDVETIASDMSFALSEPAGFEWSSNPSGWFARKKNLISPTFWGLLKEMLRFNRLAIQQVESDTVPELSMGSYLEEYGFAESFTDNYIVPMGAAIWSTPEIRLLDYPAQTFLKFFYNHRLLHNDRPTWRTVKGGSRSYVEKVVEALGPRAQSGMLVERVIRFGDHTRVVFSDEQSQVFDEVIFACHSDQAERILGDSYKHQKFALRSVRYRSNRAVLHRDTLLMPRTKGAWASWNVLKTEEEDICLTYWMNRLQALPEEHPTFVTLNPSIEPDPEKVFAEFDFEHPQFDAPAAAAVREIKRINGQDNIWFAGAWLGYGFHEDGLKSGLEVALSLGGRVPWTPEGVSPFIVQEAANESASEQVAVVG